jgi:hypothetical protein
MALLSVDARVKPGHDGGESGVAAILRAFQDDEVR